VSTAPLVLAIEPDLRQAAIVKRIVRERVLADVVVVDSRDAAIDAIRSAIPDVLLVSALLSPRDEDDLVAHLRTLEGAAHLQTHTIPQLASALGPGENGGGGLFSAFRRKKPVAAAPAGCDPDLFADEIRVFLQNAAEKKRQAAESETVTPLPIARRVSQEQTPVVEQPAEPAAGPAWASPFEWRPTADRRITPVEETPAQSEPAIAAVPFVPEPYVPEPYVPEPEPEPEPVIAAPTFVPEPEPEPVIAAATFVLEPEPEPVIPPATFVPEPEPEPVIAAAAFVPEPEPEPAPLVVIAPPAPVAKNHEPAAFNVWARKETPPESAAATSVDELHDLLACLGVPESVASVSYPQGVRIRRLRVIASKESHSTLQGAVVLSRRMLAELRGSDARV
jgi:hypothetical protein